MVDLQNSAIAAGWTHELRTWLDAEARAAGFDAVAVAKALGPDDPVQEREAARFAAWVDLGLVGDMEYLKRRDEHGSLVRSGVRVPMPWARSVVVCALNYNSEGPRSINAAPNDAGWIARYAWSGTPGPDGSLVPTDYHEVMLGRLRSIEKELLARTGCETRCYVDTGPLVERSMAVQAGLGWIGKNTCVLNQRLGSWMLLCVIVTSLEVDEADAPQLLAQDRCGTCTRCIDACPTGALLSSKDPKAPREMDARRCISYLTIEKKGDISEELREGMGRQVFGCDICQDVCPWNRRAPIGSVEGMQPRPELINPTLDWLAQMDAAEFKRRFKGSPLERTGRKRLLRNLAIAMGNSGEERFLPQLDVWAEAPSQEGSAENRNDAALREAARWARERIQRSR